MARQSKPRKPYKTPADDEVVERLVPVPGWVYNLMTARAVAQSRTTKHQLAYELTQLAKRLKEQGVKDDEMGRAAAARKVA